MRGAKPIQARSPRGPVSPVASTPGFFAAYARDAITTATTRRRPPSARPSARVRPSRAREAAGLVRTTPGALAGSHRRDPARLPRCPTPAGRSKSATRPCSTSWSGAATRTTRRCGRRRPSPSRAKRSCCASSPTRDSSGGRAPWCSRPGCGDPRRRRGTCTTAQTGGRLQPEDHGALRARRARRSDAPAKSALPGAQLVGIRARGVRRRRRGGVRRRGLSAGE
jgi:hypothetical protein